MHDTTHSLGPLATLPQVQVRLAPKLPKSIPFPGSGALQRTPTGRCLIYPVLKVQLSRESGTLALWHSGTLAL